MPDFIGANGQIVNAGSLQAALAMEAQARIDGILARWFGLVEDPHDP